MPQDTQQYTTPELTEFGSVEAITEQQFNKDGLSTDEYTDDTDGQIVGSLQKQ